MVQDATSGIVLQQAAMPSTRWSACASDPCVRSHILTSVNIPQVIMLTRGNVQSHAEAYCSVTGSCCASRPNGAVRLVACEFMPLKQVDSAAYSVPECLITTYSHTVTANPAISETAAVVQLCNFSCAQLAASTTFQIVSCQLSGRFRRRSYEICFEVFAVPEGHLHFVGNEIAIVWRGHMDGAPRSAEGGVTKVFLALKNDKAVL
jgi:hypothetical protein